MSRITINSNIAALNAQRRLGQSTSSLQQSFTRLSSGLRINRASDDSAGLSISASLNTDRRVFAQGVRNLNDGLSLLSIADSALSELTNITVRLTELAEQSANGTLGHAQREALDQEAQALKDEYFRISKTTQFNGRALFEGNFGQLWLQAGFGTDGGIVSGLGGAIGTGQFETTASYSVGNSPLSVTTGDFNGDGVLDLVTAEVDNGTVSVLLGNGNGTFSAGEAFSVGMGSSPLSVTTGDFNGDGVLDLVTADRDPNTVSVLLGNGNGTFSAKEAFSVGNSPCSVITGDFNGDGVLDLVTADRSDDTGSVLLGNGNGTFGASTSFDVGAYPCSVITGDFNGDGVLDLVTADRDPNTVSVLLGNGNGTFSAKEAFSVGNWPYSVTTGDFNGDGVLDLVTANRSDDTASVLLGDGNGTFGAAEAFSVGDAPQSVTTGDFNGDGVLDLVTADYLGNTASVLLGDGNGTFGAKEAFSVGNRPRSVITGDFNGDGVLDLVTANRSDDTASVLLGSITDGVAPLLDLSLASQADARQTLPVFKRKLDQLSAQRGQIGAFEARLTTAISTTEVATENFAAAASRITDADIAEESARLVRQQILQQAGAAVLAQANQAPALALRLLGST